MRLFIFNSSKLLFYSAFLILGLVILAEFLYIIKGIPINYEKTYVKNIDEALKVKDSTKFLILGDSRAQIGVSPEIVSKVVNQYKGFNLAAGGSSIFSQINYVKQKGIHSQILIVSVTPANVFGGFVNKSICDASKYYQFLTNRFIDKFRNIDLQLHLSSITENLLSSFISTKIHIGYGFNGFTEMLFYGEVSDYFTNSGWESNIRLGSDIQYTKEVNRYAYKNIMLEETSKALTDCLMNLFISELKELQGDNNTIMIIRIPVSEEMRTIEFDKMPFFDEYMYRASKELEVPYYMFSEFPYPIINSDGSHLNREYATRFSIDLSYNILEFINNKN